MGFLIDLVQQYGLIAVFLNVLIEQAGAPVPAYPVMLIAGAFLDSGHYQPHHLILAIVAASLIADLCWYEAGRRYGDRVLKTICRISISPDSCVRQTESIYARWGASSLLVAKFIPGFASVATALAGVVGTSRTQFIIFDALGAALWGGSAIGLGYLFRDAVNDVLAVLERLGQIGVVFALIAFGLFLAMKWWQRSRLFKQLRMARISPEELAGLIQSGRTPVVLDVRSEESRRRTGYIPLSKPVNQETLDADLNGVDRDAEIVVYCTCPNEVSAARVAKLLMQRGFVRVRPLSGGLDAWVAEGFSVSS
ncbi:MAG: DedA family protein/thiosulfate sulfurtransferase GlpE [Burkholderiales bacterium]|nr:DedA family protein/thiosulfate sulfurtransferase GlpE [Burkholderiales bacterium]